MKLQLGRRITSHEGYGRFFRAQIISLTGYGLFGLVSGRLVHPIAQWGSLFNDIREELREAQAG